MAALTLRIPPLQARNTADVVSQSVVSTPTTIARMAEDGTPAAATNPTVVRQLAARANIQGVEDSNIVVKRCFKCSMQLPGSKWPWKRCLECRLDAERAGEQGSKRASTLHNMRWKKVSVCRTIYLFPPQVASNQSRMSLIAPSSKLLCSLPPTSNLSFRCQHALLRMQQTRANCSFIVVVAVVFCAEPVLSSP